jgi:aspartate aminotransferase
VYLPQPTWANHIPIFADTGFGIKHYKYYDPSNCGLDFKGLLNDLNTAPDHSFVLLHACAHNPTGVDPTLEQWKELSALFKKKQHFAFFDCAYQGFASGDVDKDAAPVRTFVDDGHQVLVTQSFAKNFGLYGERVGSIQVVVGSADEAVKLDSQLKILIRPFYSNPPIYGARLVEAILTDPKLTALWKQEVKGMADRIISMREMLVKKLAEHGSKRSWKHITDQIGMFCYSGLTSHQVDELAAKYHIYMTRNGRISIAGINTKNVDYLAESMHAVTKTQ